MPFIVEQPVVLVRLPAGTGTDAEADGAESDGAAVDAAGSDGLSP